MSIFCSKSITGIGVVVLILIGSYASFAQRPPSAALEIGYKGGEVSFFETVGKSLHYPKEARENG